MMSIDGDVAQPDRQRYRQHAVSLERHASWACDFAVAGDFDAAMDALRDLHALACEFITRDDRN